MTGARLQAFTLLAALAAAGCGGSSGTSPDGGGGGGAGGSGDANDGPPATDAGGDAGGSDGATTSDAADAGGGDAISLSQTCKPPANFAEPAAMLTATGCVDPANPTRFAASVIPYEVQSPVWADGADIRRGFALPDGGQIHVIDCTAEPDLCPYGPEDDGKWSFPLGTVIVQSFLYDGKVVDTRLLVHQSTTFWAGYAYQWNEAQTDATLISDERRITFNTGTRQVPWHFPARLDCLECHNNFPFGATLGTETAQLNRVVDGTNQLDRFRTLGLFEAAPAMPYKAALVTPYAGQAGSPPAGATVEQRARSYLHANCSHCHRPGGEQANIDLRNDVALADTHACGLSPSEGLLGLSNPRILDPTKPMNSIIWVRMNASAASGDRMPRLGSDVVDQTAVDLVSSWITAVTACP